MRRRLTATTHTSEDLAVWAMLRDRWPRGHSAYCEFMSGDRRDAKLMYFLTSFAQRYYTREPLLPKAAQLPMVHLWTRMDPEWPAGHYIINMG